MIKSLEQRIIDLEDELCKIKTKLRKETIKISDYTWKMCFSKGGTYISSESKLIPSGGQFRVLDDSNKNVFRTEKQAKSALAMAQLSHIIYVANGCEELDWNDIENYKYVIGRTRDTVNLYTTSIHHDFLAFKTPGIRDQVYAQNKQLIHDYLMID